MDLHDLPEPLPDWLKDSIAQALLSELREHAETRSQSVARGAETPELAATLLDKFGWGMAKATAIIGLHVDLQPEIDRLVRDIYPDFSRLTQARWEAKPASLTLG